MMEPWMGVVLLLFIGLVAYVITRLVRDARQRQKESEEFLEDVQGLLGIKFDFTARDDYRKRKQTVFDAHREQKGWELSRLAEDNGGDPTNSWQRQLTTAEQAPLKAALVKRAMKLHPLSLAFQREVQQKFVLYKSGMISEKQWQMVMELRDIVREEFMEIRHDAECLQEKYGLEDQVFKEAETFLEHEGQKRAQMQQQQLRARQAAMQQAAAAASSTA